MLKCAGFLETDVMNFSFVLTPWRFGVVMLTGLWIKLLDTLSGCTRKVIESTNIRHFSGKQFNDIGGFKFSARTFSGARWGKLQYLQGRRKNDSKSGRRNLLRWVNLRPAIRLPNYYRICQTVCFSIRKAAELANDAGIRMKSINIHNFTLYDVRNCL